MEIISRADAAARGSTRFFTGQPCKHGHVAQRWVANAGCVDCVKKWSNEARKNPISHDLVPYAGVTFWRSKRHTPETLLQLNAYVQRCIQVFDEKILGKVCATCDGTHYIPTGDGTNNWKQCPDCPSDVPTTEPSGT